VVERRLAGEERALDEFLRICTLLEERVQDRDGELRWLVLLRDGKYRVGPGYNRMLWTALRRKAAYLPG
jgi:hypothetical protein